MLFFIICCSALLRQTLILWLVFLFYFFLHDNSVYSEFYGGKWHHWLFLFDECAAFWAFLKMFLFQMSFIWTDCWCKCWCCWSKCSSIYRTTGKKWSKFNYFVMTQMKEANWSYDRKTQCSTAALHMCGNVFFSLCVFLSFSDFKMFAIPGLISNFCLPFLWGDLEPDDVQYIIADCICPCWFSPHLVLYFICFKK